MAVETAKAQLASNEATILQKADESVKSKKNFSEYMKMLTFTINGIMESSLYDGSFNAEMNYKENIKYINLTESLLK